MANPAGGLGSNLAYIILCEQMERAKHLVVLEVEGTRGLEVPLEGGDARGLYDELLRRSHLSELLVVLRRREPRGPP